MTREEFDIKFKLYFNLLFKIAYGYVLNSSDAEDIVQEVFIKFYRLNKTFKNSEEEKYYIIRIAINQSIDFLKKKKKTVLANEYIENLQDNNDGNEENMFEYVCLLKDIYKTVIILYYYDNYNVKEIASILHISESNAKQRLARAREKLKEIITKRDNYGKR